MNIDHLKPDHGKSVTLDVADDKVAEALTKIVDYHAVTVLYWFMMTQQKEFKIPCIQCFKDIAMMHHDISSLMYELVKDK